MMYVTRRLIVRSHQLGTASSRMVSHLATLVLFVTAAAALSLPYGCSPPPEREDALYSIARWEDRRLADIDSLGQMISADDAHVRRAAVRAAGLIGRDEILSPLLEALTDRSRAVREEAAFALGLLGNAQAVPALSTATRDKHRGLRLAALEGLAHLDHDGEVFIEPALHGDVAEAIRAWNGLRDRAAAVEHAKLVATIQAGLSRTEEAVLWRVLRCAERAPDSTLVAQLAPFALSSSVQVRVHALRALGQNTGASALEAVLQSGEQKVRFRSRDEARFQIALLRALGRLAIVALQRVEEETTDTDAARATDLMTATVHHADPHVSRTALQGMTDAVVGLPLPPEAAERESLLPVWRIRMARAARERLSAPVAAVRAAAVGAYFALRGGGALPMFGHAMTDSSVMVREAALTAIAALDPSLANVHVLNAVLWSPVKQGRVRAVAVAAAYRIWERSQESTTVYPAQQQQIKLAVFDLLARSVADSDFVVVSTAAPLLGYFPCGLTLDTMLTAFADAAGEGRLDIQLAVLDGLDTQFHELQENGAMLDLRDTLLRPGSTAVEGSSPDTVGTLLKSAREDSLLLDMVAVSPRHLERTAALLQHAFDVEDLRIRLKGREVAVNSGLLPENLIPSAASLRATLPAHHRDFKQLPLQVAFDAPTVRCVTARGVFVIELDGKHAPNCCASFLALIRQGFYDELIFHRVVPDFVIQGGDPRGDGWGGPGYTIRSEWSRLPYERGVVGIAHSGKDTGGSQFFVTHSPQPHLNGRYTVFGQVTDGMDVVDRIQPGDSFSLVIVE